METSRRSFIKTGLSAACICCLGGIFKLHGSNPNDTNGNAMINKDEIFHLEWIRSLLDALNKQNLSDSSLRAIVKETSFAHHKYLDVENMVAPFAGKPEEFIKFLETAWGWKVIDNKDNGILIIDENKPFCVCPLLKGVTNHLYPVLCFCSEGFAERMFSAVYQHSVEAVVVNSVQKGDRSCVYNIKYNL